MRWGKELVNMTDCSQFINISIHYMTKYTYANTIIVMHMRMVIYRESMSPGSGQSTYPGQMGHFCLQVMQVTRSNKQNRFYFKMASACTHYFRM